jgi:hypothetical protein
MEMPLDIFVEVRIELLSVTYGALLSGVAFHRLSQIAFHLHPRDLLYLSRATKRLREMFMSKESRLVWRAAFENADVPEQPDCLSEPLYAALLFDYHCMVRLLTAVMFLCADDYE